MSRLYILGLLLLLISVSVEAQRNYSAEADQAFSDYQFTSAISKYEKAYDKIKQNKVEQQRILFRIGECYRNINNNKKAEAQFGKLVKANYQKTEALTLLYYADALRINQKYVEALQQYKAYKTAKPDDIRGENGIKSCEMAETWLSNPTRYEVINEKKLNTSKDDWAASFANNKYNALIFSSNRTGTTGNLTDNWTGQSFTDIFIAKKKPKGGDWEVPVLLESQNIINTQANEGPGAFDSRFNTLYFTRCGYEKKKESKCQIWYSDSKGNSWSVAELLSLASSEYDVIHPSISSDELNIYFVANMAGGMGDMDIWTASRKKKTQPFGKAENLGEIINTPGKEEFPVLFMDSILYFSSNTHPGLGGYDIFKSVKSNGKWSTPENMGAPINSSADDFEFITSADHARGYFTSNRSGGMGGDDIYSYYFPPLVFSLKGVIKDIKTNQPVKDATIKLNGSDGSTSEAKSDRSGKFVFDSTIVKAERTYELSNQVKNYYSYKSSVSTVGLARNKVFEVECKIIPIAKQPIVLPEIFFDFGKWDIASQYQDSLVGLVRTLREYKNIVVEISAYTDSRDNDEVNDALSQKRAEAVVNFLVLQGVDPGRLVAKGFGKRQPRALEKDFLVNTSTFRKGTILDDSFIKTLNAEDRENAHQLNRRTAFKVLRDDYKPALAVMEDVTQKTPPQVAEKHKPPVNTSTVVGAEIRQESKPLIVATPKPEVKKAEPLVQKDVPKPVSPATLQFTVQVGTGRITAELSANFRNLRVCEGPDKINRIITGVFPTKNEAIEYCKQAKKFVPDAFVAPIDDKRNNCR